MSSRKKARKLQTIYISLVTKNKKLKKNEEKVEKGSFTRDLFGEPNFLFFF